MPELYRFVKVSDFEYAFDPLPDSSGKWEVKSEYGYVVIDIPPDHHHFYRRAHFYVASAIAGSNDEYHTIQKEVTEGKLTLLVLKIKETTGPVDMVNPREEDAVVVTVQSKRP